MSLIIAVSMVTPKRARRAASRSAWPARVPRAATARQHVEVEAVQPDLARLHRLLERRAPRRLHALQEQVGGPQHLDVPDEPRALGIAGRLLGQRHPLDQVLDLPLFHFGLQVRVADVGVGVRHHVDGELRHRLGPRRERLAVHVDRTSARGLDRRDQHFDLLPARLQSARSTSAPSTRTGTGARGPARTMSSVERLPHPAVALEDAR